MAVFDLAALDLHAGKHLSHELGSYKQSCRFQRKSLDVRASLKPERYQWDFSTHLKLIMCLRILSEVAPTAQLSLSESLRSLQTSGCAFPFYSFLPVFPWDLASDVSVTTQLVQEPLWKPHEFVMLGCVGNWGFQLSRLSLCTGEGCLWSPPWASPPAWTSNPCSTQLPLPFCYRRSLQWQGFLNQWSSCSFFSNYFFFCSWILSWNSI